jgi:hypothetical protein
MGRAITRALLITTLLILIGWLSLAGTQPADANAGALHWAVQWAAHSSYFYHPPSDPAVDGYFGWVGVNGEIKTPTYVPDMNNPNFDHSLGNLSMVFSRVNSWVQVGWYSGTVAPEGGCPGPECITRNGSLGMYWETLYPGGGYVNTDLGTLAYGERVIYRIQWNSFLTCWDVYIRYSTKVASVCSHPGSGMPYAGSEVYDAYGGLYGPVEMPLASYGFSNPNTNNALRIKGLCSGFEPWDTALCAWSTGRYDERYSDPMYRISHYNTWWYFIAYGG